MAQPFCPRLAQPIQVNGPAAPRRVVAVAVPGSDPLELVGPLEVLNAANVVLQLGTGRRRPGYEIQVVAREPGEIYAWNGLRMIADQTIHDLPKVLDTLLVPAMDGQEASLGDRPFIQWLAKAGARARRTCSICTGTYFLAKAGLLDGRRATTHWAWCEDFARRFPKVKMDRDPIFVKDGHFYTSAGGTAGLDLMLALVEEDFGREVALKTAQFLVIFLKRPANQSQFSVQLSSQLAESDGIREVQAWVYDHLDEDLSVEALAARASMSPRNFARVFTREVGMPPGRFVEQARVECARRQLEETRAPVQQIAERCGYGTAETMRLAFLRQLGASPREYRARFTTVA
ncbi:MAG: GlxA family transcriptional regulator [Candidatus Hydrogenedentes bacterium]|nr:GlxA family transcriptional regulator [Candidatus Hydrogenedentota bacterium]